MIVLLKALFKVCMHSRCFPSFWQDVDWFSNISRPNQTRHVFQNEDMIWHLNSFLSVNCLECVFSADVRPLKNVSSVLQFCSTGLIHLWPKNRSHRQRWISASSVCQWSTGSLTKLQGTWSGLIVSRHAQLPATHQGLTEPLAVKMTWWLCSALELTPWQKCLRMLPPDILWGTASAQGRCSVRRRNSNQTAEFCRRCDTLTLFMLFYFFGLFFCETPYDRSHNICLPSIMYSLQSSLPSLQLLINCTPFNFTQYSSSLCWSQFSSQSAHLQQWQDSNQDQSKYTKVIRLVSQWKSCSYRSPADGTSWMHYKKLKLTHRQTHLLFLQFSGIWRIIGLQNYSEFDMFHFLIVWNGLGWVAVKLLSPLECL